MLINASSARQNFFKLIEKAIDHHQPITITGKQGNVVLLSEEDYKAIQETLYLLNIPGMRESIIEGMNTPAEDCIKDTETLW